MVTGQAAPGGGTYSGIAAQPAINDAGQVAFVATMTGTSGGTANNTGVFRGGVGGLVEVVREGQGVPGGNGTFSDVINFLVEPALNDVGQIAFLIRLAGTSGGTNDDHGIYRWTSGAPIQIVREGQTPPGSNGVFGDFFNGYKPINDAGHVAFAANIYGATPAEQGSVYRGDGGLLVKIARTGDQAPPQDTLMTAAGAPA